MSAFVRLGFENDRCGLHRAAHPDKVFAQQIARDFGRRTLKERWRKHTVHGLIPQTKSRSSLLTSSNSRAAGGERERAVSDPGFAMIDIAMNRPALPRATDFGKTARMDSPTVKRFLPWVIATALFMEQLDSTIVNTAVPSMAASLHVTPLSLKAVVASYILSLAVCIPVSGWIADRYGTRRVFALAIAVFTISSVFCGLAMNLPQMVVARILPGIGAAMMMPVGRLTVIRTFPKAELLQAMNFIIIPALIGPLLGPTVGGLIVHWLSWREIFFVNVPAGVVALWLIHRYMPDYYGDASHPLDVMGLAQFGAGTAVLSWLLEIFGEHETDIAVEAALFLLALTLLGAYWLRAALSVVAAGAVQGANLSRFGDRRLHHAAWRWRIALFDAITVSDWAWSAGVAIGHADDANRRRRHWHEAYFHACPGAFRIS